MDINKELKSFLKTVEFPEKRPRIKTFLDVLKRKRRELDWSNIYYNYLKYDVLGLREIMLSSITQLLNNKFKDDRGGFLCSPIEASCTILKEVSTKYADKQNKKIDLLIADSQNVFLIENKVNASVYNPLDTYHKHCREKYPDCRIIPIVLSLHEIATRKINSQKRWYNITHLELIKTIIKDERYISIKDSISTGITASDLEAVKLFLLFDDFCNHVTKDTNNMNDEEIKFCFENQAKIHQIHQYYKQYKAHIKKSVQRACEKVAQETGAFELKPTEKRYLEYLVSKKDPNIMITVMYGGLLSSSSKDWQPGHIQLAVEIKGEKLIKKAEEVKGEEKMNRGGDKWAHMYSSSKKIESNSDMNNLQSIVQNLLAEDSKIMGYYHQAIGELL